MTWQIDEGAREPVIIPVLKLIDNEQGRRNQGAGGVIVPPDLGRITCKTCSIKIPCIITYLPPFQILRPSVGSDEWTANIRLRDTISLATTIHGDE